MLITQNFGVNWQVTGANSFDDGKEGNYWDDYLTKYPNALEVGDSGTGNIPYPLTNHNNIDYHPLLEQPSISNKLPSLPATWVSLLPSFSTSPSPLPSTSSSSSPSQAPSQSVLPSNSPTTPEYPPWTILALFVISLFLVAFVLTLCKSQKKKAETSFNHYSILWLNFFFSANAKRPFLGDHNE